MHAEDSVTGRMWCQIAVSSIG